MDAKGHIAAHLKADVLQFLLRDLRCVNIPQDAQQRRHVRAAAPQARKGRGHLFKLHLQPRHGPAGKGEKRLCRPLLQCLLPFRKLQSPGQKGESLFPLPHRHGVTQRDGLHHHIHIVVAVAAAAQNIQRQIDLAGGAAAPLSHRKYLRMSYLTV